MMSFNDGILNQVRPYLQTWMDNRGNYYRFTYGTDPTQPNFGQAAKIQSSNGNYLGFDYDWYGHVIDAYSGDGRWMYYYYSEYGDLTGVALPDGAGHQYQYQLGFQSVTNGSVVSQQPYSTHLLIEVDNPDGRVLENVYDSQRRVTNQLSTAGPQPQPGDHGHVHLQQQFQLFTIRRRIRSRAQPGQWTGRGYTNRYDYPTAWSRSSRTPLGRCSSKSGIPTARRPPATDEAFIERKDKTGIVVAVSI